MPKEYHDSGVMFNQVIFHLKLFFKCLGAAVGFFLLSLVLLVFYQVRNAWEASELLVSHRYPNLIDWARGHKDRFVQHRRVVLNYGFMTFLFAFAGAQATFTLAMVYARVAGYI